MIIGEERAVDELWAASARPAAAARATTGPASRSSRSTSRRARRHRSAAGDARRPRPARPGLRRRAPGGDRHRSARARSGRASAGGRGRRSRRAARGCGPRTATILFKAEASAWTPCAVQLQQVWTDPGRARPRATRRGACATCPAAARRARPDRLPVRPARERARRSASTSASACGGRTYRSIPSADSRSARGLVSGRAKALEAARLGTGERRAARPRGARSPAARGRRPPSSGS